MADKVRLSGVAEYSRVYRPKLQIITYSYEFLCNQGAFVNVTRSTI